jgi:hypothetical protein
LIRRRRRLRLRRRDPRRCLFLSESEKKKTALSYHVRKSSCYRCIFNVDVWFSQSSLSLLSFRCHCNHCCYCDVDFFVIIIVIMIHMRVTRIVFRSCPFVDCIVVIVITGPPSSVDGYVVSYVMSMSCRHLCPDCYFDALSDPCRHFVNFGRVIVITAILLLSTVTTYIILFTRMVALTSAGRTLL